MEQGTCLHGNRRLFQVELNALRLTVGHVFLVEPDGQVVRTVVSFCPVRIDAVFLVHVWFRPETEQVQRISAHLLPRDSHRKRDPQRAMPERLVPLLRGKVEVEQLPVVRRFRPPDQTAGGQISAIGEEIHGFTGETLAAGQDHIVLPITEVLDVQPDALLVAEVRVALLLVENGRDGGPLEIETVHLAARGMPIETFIKVSFSVRSNHDVHFHGLQVR